MTELDMIVEGINEQLSHVRKDLQEFWEDGEDSEYWNGVVDGLLYAKEIVRAVQFNLMKKAAAMPFETNEKC